MLGDDTPAEPGDNAVPLVQRNQFMPTLTGNLDSIEVAVDPIDNLPKAAELWLVVSCPPGPARWLWPGVATLGDSDFNGFAVGRAGAE
jgi:hypothetical protein